MNFRSASLAINPSEIGYRSLGFGENPGLETTEYELTINLKELKENFLKSADSFILQCKIDDSQQGFADIENLKEANYASFKQLIEHEPSLAATLINDYLYFDLLDSLFPNSKNLKLVVNSIKNVVIQEDQITITGETFPFKQP